MNTRLLPVLALFGALSFTSAAAAQESPIPLDQRRGVEQTFLTYPEWFLVHSPAEYARLAAHEPPHRFPFARHIGQTWSSYYSVIQEQMHQHYPGNPGYHLMICVIATSTTVEYGLRWVYENTFGRISWAFTGGELTQEDLYGAKVAQDYVDFIRREPWYLFDFTGALKGLWTDNPEVGHGMLRKWERRYALSTEYAVKAFYGKLIEKGTRATYEPALLVTQVVVDHAPATPPKDVRVLSTLPDGRAVLEVPRYYAFRIAATELAQQGVHLVDIAGNDGDAPILVTLWAPQDGNADYGGRVLFTQPLITQPGQQRVAVILTVGGLSQFLLDAPAHGWTVEHVHDY